jgi:hypothetical protein
MKNMLLASTALVAFAGAAAAEITFSGSADLGYNDTINVAAGETTSGFYSDLDIVAGFSAELDNGLVAAASINLDDLVSNAGSNTGMDYELSLSNDTAGLYYGDTNFAAQNVWVSAGDMEADHFSEADGEEALRGEVTFGAVSAQMSYSLADSAGVRNAGDELEQLSIGASADFGNFNVVVAYQEALTAASAPGYVLAANGDFYDEEVFGLSVGTSFGGADVRLAYADNATLGTDSIGVKVAYPFGPVTATAYYVAESAVGDNWGLNLAYANGPIAVTVDYQDDQGTEDWGIEGSYDVGNGIMVYAGIDDSGEDMYVAGTYDLGSGASLLVSYADDADADNSDDEVGANDYQVGTTVEISFAF